MKPVEIFVISFETDEQSSEFVNPCESTLAVEAVFVNLLIEKTSAAAPGRFAVPPVFGYVRNYLNLSQKSLYKEVYPEEADSDYDKALPIFVPAFPSDGQSSVLSLEPGKSPFDLPPVNRSGRRSAYRRFPIGPCAAVYHWSNPPFSEIVSQFAGIITLVRLERPGQFFGSAGFAGQDFRLLYERFDLRPFAFGRSCGNDGERISVVVNRGMDGNSFALESVLHIISAPFTGDKRAVNRASFPVNQTEIIGFAGQTGFDIFPCSVGFPYPELPMGCRTASEPIFFGDVSPSRTRDENPYDRVEDISERCMGTSSSGFRRDSGKKGFDDCPYGICQTTKFAWHSFFLLARHYTIC